MSFTEAVRAGFRNWNRLDGRASRSEYWWWALFLLLAGLGPVFVFAILAAALPYDSAVLLSGLLGLLLLAFFVVTIVPSFTVAVRRLHDTDRSGWWLLIGLLPYLGGFILLIFYILDGTAGPNRYGDRPGGNVPGAPAHPLIGVADELRKLEELRAAGTISDAEFARQRARLLPE